MTTSKQPGSPAKPPEGVATLEKRLRELLSTRRNHLRTHTDFWMLINESARIGAEEEAAKADARVAEAIAKEREECARVLDADPHLPNKSIAAIIRARGDR